MYIYIYYKIYYTKLNLISMGTVYILLYYIVYITKQTQKS